MYTTLFSRALTALVAAGAGLVAVPAFAGADAGPQAGGGCAIYRFNDQYPLRQCDKGPAVEVLQRALRVVDPSLAVDGYLGVGTANAVVEYERTWGANEGLAVYGVVDAATWSSLTWQHVGDYSDTDGNGVVDPYEVTPRPEPPAPPPTTTPPEPVCESYRPDYAYPIQLCGEGEGVRLAQVGLRAADPTLVADGYFGPRTHAALEAFQARHGLPVTGEIDESTWIALTWRFVWDHGRDLDADGVIDPWEVGA